MLKTLSTIGLLILSQMALAGNVTDVSVINGVPVLETKKGPVRLEKTKVIDPFSTGMTGNETIKFDAATTSTVIRRDPSGANRDLTFTGLIKAGTVITVCNNATLSSTREELVIKSSNGDVVRRVYETTCAQVMPIFDNPESRDQWQGIGHVYSEWQDSVLANLLDCTGSPSGGTIAVNQVRWRRAGDTLEVFGHFRQTSAGSAGSGTCYFTIPQSLDMDSAKINTTDVTGLQNLGFMTCIDNTGAMIRGHLETTGAGGDVNSDLGFIWDNAGISDVWTADDLCNFGKSSLTLSYWYRVPISGWEAEGDSL